jgi:hypothetical protein
LYLKNTIDVSSNQDAQLEIIKKKNMEDENNQESSKKQVRKVNK